MFKRIHKARKRRKYFRAMNNGLFFLNRLDMAMENMPKERKKQFWRDIKSPASRVRVFRELFEALNK